MTARAPAGQRTRTGLLPEHRGVADPEYTDLRLTVTARERLIALGNEIASFGGTLDVETWRITLTGRVPRGLMLCLIGHGNEQHRGVRLDNEPPYPGEWSDGEGITWAERGHWLPCPACGHPLVWYEANFVPGYRVCASAPHHHVMVARDGRSATLVVR